MSATITVLRAGTEDSVEMYVNPEERVGEIIERCQSYWQLDGADGEYLLLKRNDQLSSEKTVISSEIHDNDVVKFIEKSMIEESDKAGKEKVDLNPEEILSLAERWLSDNIGVNSDNLELVKKQTKQNLTNLQFRNTECDEEYTVEIEGGKVKIYIPGLIEENQSS